MADFVAVLRKTLDGLGNPTPEMRAKVYDKARATIRAKLAAINPPPPQSVADKQTRALEEAIASIELDYVRAAPSMDDPLAELESVFASLKNPQPKPAPAPPPARQGSWSNPAPQPAPQPRAPAARERAAPVEPPRAAPSATVATTTLADVENDEGPRPAFEPVVRPEERRRAYGGLLASLIGLVVVAGAGYGVWLNRDAFGSLIGLGSGTTGGQETAAQPEAVPDEAAPADEAPAIPTTEGSGKFTQRLNADGSEIDPGPATSAAGVGEGTSVAAVTPPPADGTAEAPLAPVDPDDPVEQLPDAPPVVAEGQTAVPSEAAPAAAETATVPVGQKAIFYEERTTVEQGSAEQGSIVWSLVQESPGGDAPPEPAIRAEATIPGKDLQLRMTIRRNADRSLPASHIIEVIFITPEGFNGGGIENVLRVSMKGSEQEAGSPLLGIPAKIADGFFLVALTDTKAETEANLTLLRRQSWIDIPMIYKSGRRALFTMEKGIPGEKVFADAIEAWQAASAG